MAKTLTKVGNSQAIILPKRLIEKYQLRQVTLHEMEQGILIKPVPSKASFQDKLEQLKKDKQQVYASMQKQAESPEMIAYYENEALPDVNLDIVDL